MDDKKMEIKISVRNLVEFILRSGDINSEFTGSSRATEGSRLHRKIQKAQKDEYTPEVTLKHTVEYDDFVITVEGRADGVISLDGLYTIDEIKTTTKNLEDIDENYNSLHWAQAKCYAHILACRENLNSIDVRLTYCQLETEEIKYFIKTFSNSELADFFNSLLREYYIWAGLEYDWKNVRDISISKLEFPFSEYRKGQREFAVAVYKTIKNEKKIFVNAPTGTGKTISTLFPVVKAIGEGLTSKVFYLTAKTITRSVAEEAFTIMRGCGLKLKTVTLTAKEKICFREKSSCNPEDCKYAKGHFDRVNDAIKTILCKEDDLKRDVIEEYARRYEICPFEFSLDLAIWGDAVICDYNYVFDPRVFLKRFFSENGGDYTFLIDEAHNLVDRSREMFSAQLFKKTFLKLKRDFKDREPKIYKTLGKLNKFMLDMKKLCNDNNFCVTKEEQTDIYYLLRKLISQCEEYLVKSKNKSQDEELLMLYFEALVYVKISEFYDERYVTFIEKSDDDVRIKLFCLDPSYLLSEALKRGKAAVFFSATLMPMGYFREILGGAEEDYIMYLDSPFDKDNRCLMVADRISTRYHHRERSQTDIVDLIKSMVDGKKGNYMAFFPSYHYMNIVYEEFRDKYPYLTTYIQSVSMKEEEREEFLRKFRPDPSESVVGFCVLGGIFSEGIDLKDDRLIGAIIVGVGLPLICPERDIIKDYFEKKNSMGFEYSYMFPGMNKVMQAAGRVIRSEKDKGAILLIDERFTNQGYQRLFPKEWFPYERVMNNNIEKVISMFWKQRDKG